MSMKTVKAGNNAAELERQLKRQQIIATLSRFGNISEERRVGLAFHVYDVTWELRDFADVCMFIQKQNPGIWKEKDIWEFCFFIHDLICGLQLSIYQGIVINASHGSSIINAHCIHT